MKEDAKESLKQKGISPWERAWLLLVTTATFGLLVWQIASGHGA